MSETLRSFNNMLNEYITNDLVSEALLKRDWFIQNVPKDNGWKGGTIPIPFYGTKASSIKMGGLTTDTDVSKHKYVRGQILGYKEAWGTLRFEHGDLIDHDGQVNEKSFLKILPKQIDEFGDVMKEQMSKMLLTGSVAVVAASIGTNVGTVVVDRIDRVMLDQKFQLDMGATNQDVYVTGIVLDTSTVTLSATRGGGPLDLTGLAVPVIVGAKFYYDGVLVAGVVTNVFSNLRDSLLSAANGGAATLYGQNKLLYPYLQAINVLGSDITAANIMQKIFYALVTVRRLGKGNPTDVLMSYTNLGYCMANIEASKGAFNVMPGSQKASQYGWMEIQVGSVTKGMLKIVGIQECDDDIIMFIDWKALKFYSNGFFKKRIAPDGKEYFEVRAAAGYQYLVDICCFGELVVQRPSFCGILYSISIS